MRDFERDFEFDFDEGLSVPNPSDFRIDSYSPMAFIPDRIDDPEHQARIVAHTKRVKEEMAELGISKGGRE